MSADTFSAANVPSPANTNNSAQAQPAQDTNSSSVAQSNVAGDGLKCEWASCGDRLPTAELLYDHVCEKHVGRKSTNNLNLTCAWGTCRTTTVKRDHITSHIRVHVPLKPHKCDFCQKAFKRPQDLKKHVKTHAEDPNFQASPDPSRGQHPGATGVFAGQSKHVADLQHLAATASGYYPDHHGLNSSNYVAPYQNGNAANPSAYHGPSGHYQANYMTALYPVAPASNLNNEYEIRKKATFDALNEFFGEAKHRSFDPNMYQAVSQRLMSMQNLTSYSAPNDFGANHAVASAPQPAPLTNHYTLPMSNIRTKNDLQHIDQFLEQLQSTVYEHETQAAQAGVQHAGIHYQHPGLNLRTSNSPPHSHAQSHAGHHILPPISSAHTETPALTPASSVMSYNSPGSVHSQTSPVSRGSNASMYPTLPSVTSVSDVSGGALPSALASSFDMDPRRGYSSGLLQKARAEKESSVTSDGLPNIDRLGVRSPSLANVDPALTPDEKSAPEDLDKQETEDKEESWLTKVRVLEYIRGYVKQRLEKGDYVEEEEEEDSKTPTPGSPQLPNKEETEDEKDARSLYPVLQAVQEA